MILQIALVYAFLGAVIAPIIPRFRDILIGILQLPDMDIRIKALLWPALFLVVIIGWPVLLLPRFRELTEDELEGKELRNFFRDQVMTRLPSAFAMAECRRLVRLKFANLCFGNRNKIPAEDVEQVVRHYVGIWIQRGGWLLGKMPEEVQEDARYFQEHGFESLLARIAEGTQKSQG